MSDLYGISVEDEMYAHLREEFENLKTVITVQLDDGLDLSDIPPIVKQFVRSASVVVHEIQLAGDEREAVILGAFMELYDKEIERRISFPYSEHVKPTVRLLTEQTVKQMISLMFALFQRPYTADMGELEEQSALVERFGIIQRKRLGLTFTNIHRVLKQLRESGEIVEGHSTAEIALAVANVLVEENKDVYKSAAGDGWEAFFESLIAFLEKFIPLLITILGLF